MNTRVTVMLSMLAGAVVGAGAIQALHAQAKAPVYYIAEIEVTNPDAYAKEYAPKAQALIKASGGRFAAIGGAAGTGAKEITTFEGQPPKRITIQLWDSMDQIKAYRARPEFKEVRSIGDKYAKFRSFAVEGLPQ